MSENIYDILAKLPKDEHISSKEVEELVESVDPHDFVLDEARKLEEKFYKYKTSNSGDADGNPLDFKIAKAKRELQLAMAEYPEASSPEEALVARMGDQAEETKQVLDNAKATIAKQQQDIAKAAQAVDAANARYAAQEKRFQDFSQKVSASELDVKQQAQAALAFAQQPQAKPEDIIAQIQAQTPKQTPATAEPEPTTTAEPQEPEQQTPAVPAEEPKPQPAQTNVVDFEAEKKKREAEQAALQQKIGGLPQQVPDVAVTEAINTDPNVALKNWLILKKTADAEIPPVYTNLDYGGPTPQTLRHIDALAIYKYLLLKSVRNNQYDVEMLKKLIRSTLNDQKTVEYLLKTDKIANIKAVLKRQETQKLKSQQTTIDYNAPKTQPQAPVQAQLPLGSGTKGAQFDKYKTTPQQRDLFGNDNMNENIKNIAESLMERFMSFKEAAKPDFLDLDKDGDTEEPMKSAAKDAKEHEPAKVDKSAVEKRKRLQALKDKQEDERAERGDYDSKSSSRFVKGRAYGGAAQKDTEEKDDLDEVSYSAKAARAGKDIGKPGKAFAKIAKSAGERYGSKERGEKVAGAVLKKLRANEGESCVDEVSKKTLGSYVKKASADIAKREVRIDRAMDPSGSNLNEPSMQKALNKNVKRVAGLSKATDKLSQVDEVAPPGAKAERMVKHIKKGYAKDGKLTKKEKGIAYATAWKAKKAGKLEESRNHESSEYTYETVGRILSEEQPGLDCNSEAFIKAVYDELIEMKMTPKAASWLCHYDEDFISDTASAYSHFCDSKQKELAECGSPMNAFVSEEPVVDAVQELDEIARLAGLAPTMEAKCSSCGCADCECNESSCMIDEAAITEAATRKDFRMVADLLKAIPDIAKRTELALHHADIFKQQNSRFKKEMFLAAAGVDTTPIKDESIETEGNAFTGKLANTPKGGEFELDGKKFKDTSNLEEEEVASEGNEFSGALAKAKAAGEKEFEVDGKKYTVKEDINLNVSAVGEEDVVNLIRKLSGMPVVAIPAQPAVAEEVVAEEGPKERDIEHTNTPREKVAGTDAAIPAGADLNRAKKQFKKEYPGDNPMAVKEEALWKSYESMINDLKA